MDEFSYTLDEVLASCPWVTRRMGEDIMAMHETGHLTMWKYEWYKEWEAWGDQVSFNKISGDRLSIRNQHAGFNCFLGVLYRVVKDILKRNEQQSARRI